jgi:N-acetylmuramoyl-L-alanine amidase
VNRKGVVCLLILLVGCIFGDAAPRPASLQIAGKEYIRLADWARTRNLELRWIKRDESFQLSNPSSKLVFSIDSREASVNGVQVWLLFPLVMRNGGPCLAQLDAQTSLQPLISPPKNRPGDSIKTICLDPGHGGKDPGNRVGSFQEKKYTLLLAQEVRQQLIRAGLQATLTRSGDNFIELPDRPELARRKKADLFVSLHFNSTGNSRSSVRGAEVYCLTPAGASSTNARGEGSGAGWFAGNRFNEKNMALAYQFQKALTRSLDTEDRGVRRARFAVLRDATMPAVLVEAGFMSHPTEGKKIFDSTYRRQMAKAIVDGLLAYKKAVEAS